MHFVFSLWRLFQLKYLYIHIYIIHLMRDTLVKETLPSWKIPKFVGITFEKTKFREETVDDIKI